MDGTNTHVPEGARTYMAGPAPDRFDPLLVNLHDGMKHYCANKDQAKARGPLMEAVAALLDTPLAPSERLLAADVLVTLIKQAETDLRKSLSERLAVREDLPETLLHYLVYGEIDIAEAPLLYSPMLSDTDLMYVIHAKAEDHWRVIARRPRIGERVIGALADTGDISTAEGLLINETLSLGDSVLDRLAPMAQSSEDFARVLVSYRTLPPSAAAKIYWHVSAGLRQKVMERFPTIPADILDAALQDSVQDFANSTAEGDDTAPSALMVEAARHYAANGRITPDMLVDVLRRRQGGFFRALFAEKTGLDEKTIASMMRQKGGHGLAIACRSIHMRKEMFVSIFLLCRTIEPRHGAVTADELRTAMRSFDNLTPYRAQKIIADSTGQ